MLAGGRDFDLAAHTCAKIFKLDESAGLKSPIVGVSNRNKAPDGPLRSRSPWHEGAYRSDAVLEVHLRTHQEGATENALIIGVARSIAGRARIRNTYIQHIINIQPQPELLVDGNAE